MNEETVAPNEVREKPMIRMTMAQYYEWLLEEQVREAAAKKGIEIVDERGVRPRLVASEGAVVLPLKAAEGGRDEA
jgi:hypothetical protein